MVDPWPSLDCFPGDRNSHWVRDHVHVTSPRVIEDCLNERTDVGDIGFRLVHALDLRIIGWAPCCYVHFWLLISLLSREIIDQRSEACLPHFVAIGSSSAIAHITCAMDEHNWDFNYSLLGCDLASIGSTLDIGPIETVVHIPAFPQVVVEVISESALQICSLNLRFLLLIDSDYVILLNMEHRGELEQAEEHNQS